MRKIKASELILDESLYPRAGIDPRNVRGLVDSIRAGAKLPPIVIDAKTKKVVDGWHRIKAYVQVYGKDAEIEVVETRYSDDADMFLDAMRYNSIHGYGLDVQDRVHCTIIAERLSIPASAIAGALFIPERKIEELRTCRTALDSDGLQVALKRTNSHMAGKHLTDKQVEANNRSGGMNQSFYVNQIIDLIESGLLDKSDKKLLERLQVLHGLLDGILAV